jgi:hypothetical protein
MQTMRETEKERVQMWERCGKTNSVSIIKLTVGKTQLTSFGVSHEGLVISGKLL